MASQTLRLSDDPPTFQMLDNLRSPYCNNEVIARLVHFWEARNFKKGNTLMGLQMLLIDSETIAVQAFIPANRIFRYENELKAGSVYRISKFMVNAAKPLFKVCDHKKSLLFTDQTTMLHVLDETQIISNQKFRLRCFSDFAEIVDRDTDLFDVIGQLRLITGDNLLCPTATEAAPQVIPNRSKDRVFVHLLMKDGETVRLYLWDKVAARFRERWNADADRPTVLLITTVNSRTIGGAVTLSSTTSSRIFFDMDIDETKDFSNWLGAGTDNIPIVSSSTSAITKLETVTLKEIYAFVEHEIPQVASFYCFATVIDVPDQEAWYYISCRCRTKLEKFGTSFYCPKCKKTSNVGLARYRFEVAVQDAHDDIATFVLFDQDGENIAGRSAKEFLKNQNVPSNEADEVVTAPMPQSLKSIVGRTYKFHIKVSTYNFEASRQTFSVSRLLEDDRGQQEQDTPAADNDEESKRVGKDPAPYIEPQCTDTVCLPGEREQKRLRLGN